MSQLSEETKLRMRLYSQRKRAEYRALNPLPFKEPKTEEQRKEYHRSSSREYARRKNKTKPENYRFGVTKVKKPKLAPMQKALKRTPEEIKEVKPPKPDMFKQETKPKIKAADPTLVRVKLNNKTWVDVKPGYDIDALRRKFGIL